MTLIVQDDKLLLELQQQAEQDLAAGDVAFEAASEEEVYAFVEDTSELDSALNFVSLRGRCGAWDANQGTARKTLPPVIHYNGPATGVANGADPVARLIGSANYHRQIDWGGGARANGLQYHSAVWGNKIYLCRNPLSILWHAANGSYNFYAHGCQAPIGGNEATTMETRRTLKAWFDEINRTWGTRGAKSHREVSQTGTDCPGRTINDWLKPYLGGSNFGGTPAKPAPSKPSKPSPSKTLYTVEADGKQTGVYSNLGKADTGALWQAGDGLKKAKKITITKSGG